jgi:hypothetical protein
MYTLKFQAKLTDWLALSFLLVRATIKPTEAGLEDDSGKFQFILANMLQPSLFPPGYLTFVTS